jgi:hypothetical protein
MALFIGSRSAIQCRSHHQKLSNRFGEVKNLISNLKKRFEPEAYQKLYKVTAQHFKD